MNQTQELGYFTEDQVDRMNCKTMANMLREPWNGQHLLTMLVILSDMGVERGLTPDEAKADVVEWYCGATVDEVTEQLEMMSHRDDFQKHYQVIQFMHADPVGFQKAMDAIQNGWTPGMPTKFQDDNDR